ncbi:MAG: hypothetical protein HPY50_20085 [Firmicutes bacterium]|nr:hypothetical protein [Bacillota bacterium]
MEQNPPNPKPRPNWKGIATPVLVLFSLLLLTATLVQGSMIYRIQVQQYQRQQESSQPQFTSVYLSMPLNDFLIKVNSPSDPGSRSFWGYPIVSNDILSDLLRRYPEPEENSRKRITLLMITQKGKEPVDEAWIEFDRVCPDEEIEIFDNSDLMDERMASSLEGSGVSQKKTLSLGRLDTGEGRLIPLFVSDYSGEEMETKKITSRTVYIPGTLTFVGSEATAPSPAQPVKATLEAPSHISVVYVF